MNVDVFCLDGVITFNFHILSIAYLPTFFVQKKEYSSFIIPIIIDGDVWIILSAFPTDRGHSCPENDQHQLSVC